MDGERPLRAGSGRAGSGRAPCLACISPSPRGAVRARSENVTLSKPAHEVIATVLGAGTMGAGIAAHLANAGCKTFLLDIVPPSAGKDAPPAARSSIAAGALKALARAKPPAVTSRAAGERITPGTLEADLERAVAQSDLVVEAVVERLDVKQQLFSRVAAAAKPDTILATNTSGIPIGAIAQVL